MTLPISSIINVTVTIAPTAPPKQGFGVAAVVTPENFEVGGQQPDRIRFYASIEGVGEDWDPASETYKCAAAYFSQSPSPTTFATIAQYDLGNAGSLTGGVAPSIIAAWNAITDGEFAITIGATSADISGLDFNADADLDAVALTIQTALQLVGGEFATVTCTYDTPNDQFIINSSIIGSDVTYMSALSVPVGTDIIIDFKGDLANGAILTAAVSSETEVDALEAGSQASQDWYGVLLLKGVRDNQVQLDVAAWTEARTKIFSCATNNPNSTVLGDIDNNAKKLFDLNYTRTCCTYSSSVDQYPDAAVLGKAFPVNFDAPDSVITLKFKPLAGVLTEQLSSTQKAALDEKRCNAFISVGSASIYAEGYMSSQLFFDERHGIDWMTGEIESNVFSYLLSRPTKVPLTDKGGAALQQQVIRALDSSLSNGLLGIGTTSSGEFLGTGYKTDVQKVADMNPADKANRIAPTISFTALLAGAVHFVQINGIVER